MPAEAKIAMHERQLYTFVLYYIFYAGKYQLITFIFFQNICTYFLWGGESNHLQ